MDELKIPESTDVHSALSLEAESQRQERGDALTETGNTEAERALPQEQEGKVESNSGPSEELLKADVGNMDSQRFQEELKMDLMNEIKSLASEKNPETVNFISIDTKIEVNIEQAAEMREHLERFGDHFEEACRKEQELIVEDFRSTKERLDSVTEKLADLQERAGASEAKFNALQEALVEEAKESVAQIGELPEKIAEWERNGREIKATFMEIQEAMGDELKTTKEQIEEVAKDTSAVSEKLGEYGDWFSEKTELVIEAFQKELGDTMNQLDDIAQRLSDWNRNSELADLPERQFAKTMEDLAGVQQWIEANIAPKEVLWSVGEMLTSEAIGMIGGETAQKYFDNAVKIVNAIDNYQKWGRSH